MPFNSEYEIGDISLDITQRPEETTDGSKLNANSGTVWDASLVLGHYMAHNSKDFLNKKGVELGSGTGILGIYAAALGMRVTLTDYEDVLQLTRENILKNKASINKAGGSAFTATLQWENTTKEVIEEHSLQDIDFILGSDLVCAGLYHSSPLVKLIHILLQCSPSAVCLLAHELREEDQFQKFIDAVKSLNMRVQKVPNETLHPQFRCDDIAVLKIYIPNE